jgi:hypothetical protein
METILSFWEAFYSGSIFIGEELKSRAKMKEISTFAYYENTPGSAGILPA